MGGRRAKVWTYLILAAVLAIGVIVFNFVISNPEMAKSGVKSIAGLPAWAFAAIAGVLGIVIFWGGLKVETDWPEAFGAMLIAGSVMSAEFMIGWKKFALGGIVVIPFVIPVVVFVTLLMIGMAKSR